MLLERSTETVSDAKGRRNRSLPSQVARVQDQLIYVGSTPNPRFMVKTALNAVTEDRETFVQSIFSRASLPSWKEMWLALRQEEIIWLTKVGSNSKGIRVKKEEEKDATLASAGQQRQQKRKKQDISKVKCFKCEELGHFAT